MNTMTPRQIVEELDKYIIGQDEAKRAVAIALRNRYRRSRLDPEIREDITPKNILMVGPTGVGKTEIARRLAKLVDAPLVKVEATKFTEVGYVGRDVDSMVRDLVETSLRLVKERMGKDVEAVAEQNAQERILDALIAKEKGEKTLADARQESERLLTDARNAADELNRDLARKTEAARQKLSAAETAMKDYIAKSLAMCLDQVDYLEKLPHSELPAAQAPAQEPADQEPAAEAAPEQPAEGEVPQETAPEENLAQEPAPSQDTAQLIEKDILAAYDEEKPAQPLPADTDFRSEFKLDLDELKFGRNYEPDK